MISPKELPPEERLERLKAVGEPSRRLGRLPEGRTGRPSLGPPQRRRAATVRPGWAAIGGKGMENPRKVGVVASIVLFETRHCGFVRCAKIGYFEQIYIDSK